MFNFDFLTYLIGVGRAIPAVLLALGAVWLMLRVEDRLEANGVLRLFRVILLSALGFGAGCLISLITYTPFNPGFHELPAAVVMFFMVYAFVECKGIALVNAYGERRPPRFTVRQKLTAVSVAFVVIMGLYDDSFGLVWKIVFVLGTWVPFIAEVWTSLERLSDNVSHCKGGWRQRALVVAELLVIVGDYVVLWYFCHNQFIEFGNNIEELL